MTPRRTCIRLCSPGGDDGNPRARLSTLPDDTQGGRFMATYTRDDVLSWRGRDLYGTDGDKIGSIDEIYLDRETDDPEWAVVTTGLFGTKRTFVPLRDAQPSEDGIRVPFEKATVKDAPNIDPDGELSRAEEQSLYQHYGREYADYDTGSGVLDGGTGTSAGTCTGTTTGTTTDADAERGERGGPGRDTSGPN